MGGKPSKPVDAAAVSAEDGQQPTTPVPLEDWGDVPQGPTEDEGDIMDMVLTAWGNCKAKPSPTGLYKSDEDEAKRRSDIAWRKRASFIELNCGEDSFFVSNTYKTLGVADGVGGWKDEGIDAAVFSNKLMQYSKLYSETHRKILDPEVILTEAFNRVKAEGQKNAGSSTACIASLITEKDKYSGMKRYFLDVANLGDSGCIVVRNNKMIFRAHEKVHGFNAPFQLSVLPPRLAKIAYCDNPSDVVRQRVEVQAGDVVMLATDGVFDNRFNTQICENVGHIGEQKLNSWEDVPIIGAMVETIAGTSWKIDYQDPYRVAQREIMLAYKNSISKDAHTPWSSMLTKFGVKNAKGGKVDDMTLVLARVASRDEHRRATMW